jgi:hypothetical protein
MTTSPMKQAPGGDESDPTPVSGIPSFEVTEDREEADVRAHVDDVRNANDVELPGPDESESNPVGPDSASAAASVSNNNGGSSSGSRREDQGRRIWQMSMDMDEPPVVAQRSMQVSDCRGEKLFAFECRKFEEKKNRTREGRGRK